MQYSTCAGLGLDQRVLLSASTVSDSSQHASIWNEFLAGVKEKGITNIETVEDLKKAIGHAAASDAAVWAMGDETAPMNVPYQL